MHGCNIITELSQSTQEKGMTWNVISQFEYTQNCKNKF
jgi:hypothetical protein